MESLDNQAVSSPADLPSFWRHRSQVLKECSAEPQAKVLEMCAEQLELSLNYRDEELVSLTEAARAKGYTPDHIGRLVRQGKLKDYGRPKAPRVRLSELPRKPGTLPSVSRTTHLVGATTRQVARAIAMEVA
jgi:hypothetical protein